MYTFNPSMQESETSEDLLSLRPTWPTEFQDSQVYTEKPCIKKNQISKKGGGEQVGGEMA